MAVFRLSISICLLQPLESAYHHQGRRTYMHELANGYLTRHGGLKVRCFYYYYFFGGGWGGLEVDEAKNTVGNRKTGPAKSW